MSEKLVFADTVRIKANDIEFESPNPIGFDNVTMDLPGTDIVAGMSLTKTRNGFTQLCNVTGALVASNYVTVTCFGGINEMSFIQLDVASPVAMTAAAPLTIVGALPFGYKPNSGTPQFFARLVVSGVFADCALTFLANGDISVNKNSGNFAIGDLFDFDRTVYTIIGSS